LIITLAMPDFNFQPYRDFILLDGDKQWALYTPTDTLLPLQVGMIAQRERGDQTDFSQERVVEQLPVLDGLRKYALGDQKEHVILAGRPGSGKSTALQQLRLALAAEGLVPVLVQLKGDRSIPEMIQGEFRRAKQKVSLDQIDDWLLADRLVLLLDGVNEIPTDDLRRGLADFRDQNATVPMIFTTRDLAVGGDLGIKQRLEMKPLTELQMRKFVGKHLPVDGEKLLGQLGNRLREIAETPLLLRMLCDVFSQTGQIPENKGELFRLFDREYDKFKVLPPVSEDFRRFKSEILQHLAFVMMTGDSSKPTEFWLTIDRDLAEREIEKFLSDRVNDPATKAKKWIENLKNYYLLQDAADFRQIEFHHQLFQEYYAAEKLLGMFHDGHSDILEDERFQHFYLNYLKWTEPIVLILEIIEDETTVMRIIRLSETIDLSLMVLFIRFTKPCFKDRAVKIINDLIVPKYLKDRLLLRAFKHSNYYHGTSDLSTFLSSIFNNKKNILNTPNTDIAPLSIALRDKFHYISRGAIDALGDLRSDAVIPSLLAVLADRDDVVDRFLSEVNWINYDDGYHAEEKMMEEYSSHFGAIKALGKIESSAAIKAMANLMKNSASNTPRWMIVSWVSDALEKIQGDLAGHILPDLLKVLLTESDGHTFDIIQAIQANCRFYNYDIFCFPCPQNTQPLSSTATINNYTIENLGILNTGKVDIYGNQTGETP
jgi:hypothetical protein